MDGDRAYRSDFGYCTVGILQQSLAEKSSGPPETPYSGDACATGTTDQSLSSPGWNTLRQLVAVILLVAVVAKVIYASRIVAGGGLLASRTSLLCVIAFESASAVYVLLGQAFRSWLLTIGLFAVFAMWAGFAFVTGQDCNCAGESIPPHYMLAMDLAILAVALFLRPAVAPSVWSAGFVIADPAAAPRTLFGIRLLPLPIVLCCAIAAIIFTGTAALRLRTTAGSPLVHVMVAEQMVGNQWPLNSQLHAELAALESGRWLVLVLRSDCDHCRELVVRHFGDPSWHRPGERTAVFVAGGVRWPFCLDHISLDPIVNKVVDWPVEPFVASPLVCVVTDGIVVEAADGADTDRFCKEKLR